MFLEIESLKYIYIYNDKNDKAVFYGNRMHQKYEDDEQEHKCLCTHHLIIAIDKTNRPL